jgi:acyl dehydratase
MTAVSTADLQSKVGEELGVSDWFLVDQERIDAFADATMDHQFIHVDPAAAAMTPFGSTIAHGFLTLSLIVPLTTGSVPTPEGTLMGINYGLDKVRFLEPVRVNSRIRTRSVLRDVADKGDGRWLVKTEVTMEIEGSEKPAMVAESLAMFITG